MNSTPKRKKKIHWFHLLFVIAAILGLARIGGQIKTCLELQDQAAALRVELAEAQNTYERKLAQVELLNDDAYIARMARERLGMVYEGETVVMTVDPSQGVVAAAPLGQMVPME